MSVDRTFDLNALEALEQSKLAPTGARFELLRQLNRRQEPVSVSGLVKSLGLNQSGRISLYRTLKELERAGLIRRIRFLVESEDRFELGGPLRKHHHHAICESCKTTWDVQAEPSRPRTPRGFKLLGHQLEFYGLCARCAKGTA